eukprot:6204015-Pleurochrysis_carterae.AAC.7
MGRRREFHSNDKVGLGGAAVGTAQARSSNTRGRCIAVRHAASSRSLSNRSATGCEGTLEIRACADLSGRRAALGSSKEKRLVGAGVAGVVAGTWRDASAHAASWRGASRARAAARREAPISVAKDRQLSHN